MTNQDVIDQAFYEIFVIESPNTAGTDDSADAMAIFNRMMAAWSVSDMDLHFFAQDDLTATAPIPDWAEEGVISNLAVKLAVPFEARITQELFDKAREGRNVIGRTLMNLHLEGSDMSHLPQGSLNQRYNIQTDT